MDATHAFAASTATIAVCYVIAVLCVLRQLGECNRVETEPMLPKAPEHASEDVSA
jgi:hypothetical protein